MIAKKSLFGYFVVLCCAFSIYFVGATYHFAGAGKPIATPAIQTADELSLLLARENLKKEFALSFQFYARNQGIVLSQFKAEYYASIVIDRAEFYQIKPQWVKAVLVVESGARENAISSKGAIGLMQVMPATARLFDCHGDLFAPEINIDCGAKILKLLTEKYGEYAAVRYYLCGEGSGGKYDCLYGQRTEAYLAGIKREADA